MEHGNERVGTKKIRSSRRWSARLRVAVIPSSRISRYTGAAVMFSIIIPHATVFASPAPIYLADSLDSWGV
ncbi:hypothetical protein K491DRAFT_696755 [Lophiostoma macrostomum CBS 122681]|uniref:Uncharacterized protein n=1 Tax=Lophiostoma macrostomum CBS 122681 TaxID=1314788 RepID=A0A6A6STX7_9PLEO|nr:hypothetical protein K491DRAFT_696755 [Lophiostoma macrostomum CBS 122681]